MMKKGDAMFRLEIFYDEMLEKLNQVDLLIYNQMIQEKVVQGKEKTYITIVKK